MKRKRHIKLLMSKGFSRNEANYLADCVKWGKHFGDIAKELGVDTHAGSCHYSLADVPGMIKATKLCVRWFRTVRAGCGPMV